MYEHSPQPGVQKKGETVHPRLGNQASRSKKI